MQGEFDAVAESGSPALAALNAEIASVRAPIDHMLRGSPRPFRRAAVASETRQELTPTRTPLPRSRGNRSGKCGYSLSALPTCSAPGPTLHNLAPREASKGTRSSGAATASSGYWHAVSTIGSSTRYESNESSGRAQRFLLLWSRATGPDFYPARILRSNPALQPTRYGLAPTPDPQSPFLVLLRRWTS
jgi:hypothetical protein